MSCAASLEDISKAAMSAEMAMRERLAAGEGEEGGMGAGGWFVERESERSDKRQIDTQSKREGGGGERG